MRIRNYKEDIRNILKSYKIDSEMLVNDLLFLFSKKKGKRQYFKFQCRKCMQEIACTPTTLINSDCPNCGEEAGELWVLIGKSKTKK